MKQGSTLFTLSSPPLPLQVSISFKNQANDVWLQAPMGLIACEWGYIHTIYLQYLGANIAGRWWVSSLIGNLWVDYWYIFNYRNHTLHATDGPTKIDILDRIDTINNYHFLTGVTGPPQIFRFLFKTNSPTLLPCPVCQQLSCIYSTSIVRRLSQCKPRKVTPLLDIYQIILDLITNGRLVPSLSKC